MSAAAAPPPWSRAQADLLADLDASAQGLSDAEAAARLARDGPNLMRQDRGASAWRLLLRQFASPLVLILLFAGVVAGVVQAWIDAGIILAMVLGSTLLGFSQEHRASRAVARLTARLELTARVRRGGRVAERPAAQVVRGDVVVLAAGALVPADALVLWSKNLLVSEAALTGEAFPVEKRPGPCPADAPVSGRTNIVFMGSSVRSGEAEAVVFATGRATEFGEIAEQLRRRPIETDFARGIRRFGLMLLQVMVAIVLFVLIVNHLLGRPFIDSLLFSVALGLGMSPELLPAIVSVTLAAGATRLADRGVIVRQLEAIENLGGMTVFCTDKTGTLTEGRIDMTAAVDPAGRPSRQVAQYGYLNAAFESGIDNPLDRAVLAAARAADLDSGDWRKCDEVPYDFTRKRLSVVLESGGRRLMVVKGAFASVIDACRAISTEAGPAPLDAPLRARAEAYHAEASAAGQRLLAVATREPPAQDRFGVDDERDLRLEGFLVFVDPPKPEAHTAIRHLADMGVAIKVLSGDNRHVVRHVAAAVGLGDAPLLTGAELAAMKPDALLHHVERATLFAEVDPQQKERIVRALHRQGHCVGYLGDGINDAPALYAADVGVSVDGAVDVARESADVVLLRRDLDILREGVAGGRRTFANTLKYISITTSANFGNMVSMALAAPLLPFLPMSAKQILLNNLFSDLPAMAISGDRVDPGQLAAAQRISIRDMARFMLIFGLISSAADLLAFGLLLRVFHTREATFQTAWFVLSLLTELAVVMVLRTRGPAWRSRPSPLLLGITVAVFVAAVAAPYAGPAAALFGFRPLPPALLGALFLLLAGYLAATEIAKRWAFPRSPKG
jgi:Mg2+-importing ATPase